MMTYLVDCADAFISRESSLPEEEQSDHSLPELLVPPQIGVVPVNYLDLPPITSSNEDDQEPGMFGWCVVSRKPANYYCKESRLPIHSSTQKLEYLRKETACELQNSSKANKKSKLENNMLSIMKNILSFAFLERRNQELSAPFLKMAFIDLAHNILQNPSQSLISNNEFTIYLKQYIIKPLMKNCTSNNVQILSNSLSIFYFIIKFFRHFIVEEVSVVILSIVIPMIESVNNLYHSKSMMIKLLRNIV